MGRKRMSELPESWVTAAIGDVTLPIEKGAPASDFVYVDISSIDNGSKQICEPKELTSQVAPSRARQNLRKADVLVSMTRPNLNAVAIVPSALDGAVGSTGFDVLRANASISPEWLFSHVRSPRFVHEMSAKVQGALYPAVKSQDVREYRIELPPLNEQRRIVAKLEACEARIGAARAALDEVPKLLEQYRQSVLAAAFRGDLTRDWREAHPDVEPATELLARLRTERRQRWEQAELARYEQKGKSPTNDWRSEFDKPEDLPESLLETLPGLPSGWCWVRFKQLLTEMRNGIATKPDRTTGLRILRISAVRPGSVDLNDIRYLPEDAAFKLCDLSEGDLLFTRYNGNPDLVGVCGIVRGLCHPTVYPDKLIRVRLVADDFVCPEYVMRCLNGGAPRRHIERCSKTAAGQVGISGSDLKDAPVPLAPIPEQIEIARMLRIHFDLMKTAQQVQQETSSSLTTLTQSLLAKAFRGELVPQDPDDEPASVLLERIRAERESQDNLRAV